MSVSIKKSLAGALLGVLCCCSHQISAEEFAIEGLVTDQTISRVGHLFYDALVEGWDIPKNASVISIHERPDVFAGNIVWIEVDDVTVFQARMGTRTAGIEEKAEAARQFLDMYFFMQKESLQELEVY